MEDPPSPNTPLCIQVTPEAAAAYQALDQWRREFAEEIISRWLISEGNQAAEIAQRLAEPMAQSDVWLVEIPVDHHSPDGECLRCKMRADSFDFWMADENGLSVTETMADLSGTDLKRAAWFKDSYWAFVRVNRENRILRFVGPASEEDAVSYRAPRWIQSSEVPTCCGVRMYFVGQIDDDEICNQAPPGAVLWWHDAASFYVFTCAICLGTKAVGQQY